ncbi:tryptophan-rich sensory protein [Patescibacteria group bacterium]|nr:tryptophan-rich sensory protein [Patescibacteria group bacterium]
MPKNFLEWMLLLFSVGISHVAGIIGSLFTLDAIPNWYAMLTLPSFAPPNWLFGPVWLTLYTLMGIALFLVWRKGTWLVDVKWGVRVFFFQLIINALWSIMFFGLQNPLYGLVTIGLLVLSILATMFYFFRVSKIAGFLMVPYLLWVSFAAYLNYSIWSLN